MKGSLRKGFFVCCFLIQMILGFILASPALADLTYYYTGNSFDTSIGYSGKITGYLSFSIVTNGFTGTINGYWLDNYQFTDNAGTVWTPSNSSAAWYPITFSNGNIVQWTIAVGSGRDNNGQWMVLDGRTFILTNDPNNGIILGDNELGYFSVPVGDLVYISETRGTGIQAENYVAGAWTTSPVPIPGAVWLLASGLAGLIGLKRKRLG